MVDRSSDSPLSPSKNIKIGSRRISNNICACFCCDTIDGQKKMMGTFIPRLSEEQSQAPSCNSTNGEWVRRFDMAVEELAKIATEYRTHVSDESRQMRENGH